MNYPFNTTIYFTCIPPTKPKLSKGCKQYYKPRCKMQALHVRAFCNQGRYPSSRPDFLSQYSLPLLTHWQLHFTWQIPATRKGTSASTSRIADSSAATQYSVCVSSAKWSLPLSPPLSPSLSRALEEWSSHTCFPSELTRTVCRGPLFLEDIQLAFFNWRSWLL